MCKQRRRETLILRANIVRVTRFLVAYRRKDQAVLDTVCLMASGVMLAHRCYVAEMRLA